MARGRKAKRRIPSIPHVVTWGSIWQSATPSHGCQLQPCAKGEAFFGFFCFIASGIHQQRVFKLECTNNNKLDRWVLENLTFWASLEFFLMLLPVNFQRPSMDWSGAVVETQTQPIDSAATLFSLFPASSFSAFYHLALTYTLQTFSKKLYIMFSTNWSWSLPSRPCQRWNQTENLLDEHNYTHIHT